MGEELVGAYLKVIKHCDVISYNVRPRGGGLRGLEELDVVGLRFRDATAFLCEVTTHIGGLLYKDNPTTVRRITEKYERQRRYAREELSTFKVMRFQFWSPNVPKGYLTRHLAELEPGLELVINGEYTRRVDQLRAAARDQMNNEGNDVFRLLQILEHLKDD